MATWKNEEYWEVAAHYKYEYGGISRYETPAGAMEARDRMLANGFQNVHIRRVKIERLPDDARL